MIYGREDIFAKLLSREFPFAESFFVEINLNKKKWMINCSYNPHINNVENNLDNRQTDTLPNTKTLYFLVILMHALMMKL